MKGWDWGNDRLWLVPEEDHFRSMVGPENVGPVDVEGADWRVSMADARMGWHYVNGRTYLVIEPQWTAQQDHLYTVEVPT